MQFFGGIACRRFRRLSSEELDRTLSPRESRFLSAHRQRCQECHRAQTALSCSMNLLREAMPEFEPSPSFDDRLMRRLRLVKVRTAAPYWLPALVGAGIGALGLFGLLQILSGGPAMRPLTRPVGEARRVANPNFIEPQLVLPTQPPAAQPLTAQRVSGQRLPDRRPNDQR
jgi:anti-sigma factor RsiW